MRAKIGLLALFAAVGSGGNIVLNGDFEADITGPTNWVNGASPWGVGYPGNGAFTANTGSNYVDNGCLGSGCLATAFLYQDLATVIGTYTLTFAYDLGYNLDGVSGPAELQVFFNGSQVFDVAATNSNTTDPGWVQVTVSGLTATSTTTRLEFFARDDPAFLGLDTVSVVDPAVPEPSTLSLIGIGLAACGFVRHRKR